MLFLRLLGRALRWRAAASLAVFLVAAIAVLAAVIGPIYLSAASRIVLSQRLAETPHGALDLTLGREAAPLNESDDLRLAVREAAQVASRSTFFGPTVVSEAAQVRFVDPGRVAFQGRLGNVDDQCAHLRFTAGACPKGVAQIAISARSAKLSRFELGDKIALSTVKDGYAFKVVIAGVYEPIAAKGAFWSPFGFFDQRPALFRGQSPFLDTFLADQAMLQNYIRRVSMTVKGVAALDIASVTPDNENAVRGVVGAAQAAAQAVSHDQLYPVSANSGLPARLDAIDHELSLTRTLVDLATLQLALLAICVLYAIVSATASAHGGEVALAKLRGRRSIGTLAQGLAEPVVLVLAAAPVGALLAWVAVRQLAPHTLGAVSIDFPPDALLVTVLTAVAAVVAASLAARRIVRAPVGALLRRGSDPETNKVGLLVADVAALTIALAGLLQLSYGGVLTKGKANPLSALAPTLLAVAVAVVGLRLLPLAARAAIVATRESRRLAPFLAVRQILRRANSTRLALLVSVALALATLAVTTWSVADTNRDIRAQAQVGADRVVFVSLPPGLDLDQAVDKADPGGHDALAAEILPVNSTQLLAIQSKRMPGIAAWRSDYSKQTLPQLIKQLNPKLPPPLTLTGHTVAVDLDVKTLTAGVPLTARLIVSQPNHIEATVDLGNLTTGKHTYHAELPPGCLTSCRVAQFGLFTRGGYDAPFNPNVPQYDPSFDGVLSKIIGDHQSSESVAAATYFSDDARWRPGGAGGELQLSAASSGLSIMASPDQGSTNWPSMLANDQPDHLPAVVASSTARLYPGAGIHDVSSLGLDGASVPLDGLAISAVLPRLGKFGTMVDLSLAYKQMIGLAESGLENEVWMRRGAPVATIEDSLKRQGVKILSTDSAGAHRDVLDHTGPAYADTVFLIAALAATILAIGGAVLAALVTARRRSYELAALEAVGIHPRTLRWASTLEQGLLIGLGVLFGVAAGIGGSAMALPSTPIFVDPADGPPIEYGLPWNVLLLLIAGLVVVLAILCVVMARTIESQASATRLREAAA